MHILVNSIKILFFYILIFVSSCNYSFKGASAPEGIKTIYIPSVIDNSSFGLPNLSEDMTNLLKSKFIRDNTLEYAEKTQSDSMLECIIKSVSDEPLVVSGNEQVARRKVTIVVAVNFINLKKQKDIWKKDFSNWGEYESSDGSFSKQSEGIISAQNKITDDILIEVISNW